MLDKKKVLKIHLVSKIFRFLYRNHRRTTNPQESNNAEARSQQSHFAILLKSHLRTDTPKKTRRTSAEHPPPGEHLWGTASTCQKNFKKT